MNFQVSNFTGKTESLRAEIGKADRLPKPVALFISSCLDAIPPEFNGARVDAVGQSVSGTINVHLTIVPLKLV